MSVFECVFRRARKCPFLSVLLGAGSARKCPFLNVFSEPKRPEMSVFGGVFVRGAKCPFLSVLSGAKRPEMSVFECDFGSEAPENVRF